MDSKKPEPSAIMPIEDIVFNMFDGIETPDLDERLFSDVTRKSVWNRVFKLLLRVFHLGEETRCGGHLSGRYTSQRALMFSVLPVQLKSFFLETGKNLEMSGKIALVLLHASNRKAKMATRDTNAYVEKFANEPGFWAIKVYLSKWMMIELKRELKR